MAWSASDRDFRDLFLGKRHPPGGPQRLPGRDYFFGQCSDGVALRRELQLAAAVAAFVLVIGLLASVILSRRATEPVARLTAAAADVEAEAFDPKSLTDVTTGADELRQLARVFVRMAREVQSREERLKEQVQALRIEIDEAWKAQQVAEITESA